MKKILLLTFCGLLFLTGCNKNINESQIKTRSGKLHEENKTEILELLDGNWYDEMGNTITFEKEGEIAYMSENGMLVSKMPINTAEYLKDKKKEMYDNHDILLTKTTEDNSVMGNCITLDESKNVMVITPYDTIFLREIPYTVASEENIEPDLG